MMISAIILVVTVMGFPALSSLIKRARMTGYVQEASIHMARARQEAVRRGVPVVVQARYDTDDIFAWANVDLDPALTYEPDPTQPLGTVDYEVSILRIRHPNGVFFHGPADNDPEGPDAMDGGTDVASSPHKAIVFLPNGSVRDVGAIRIADPQGNFLEARVGPAATGRVRTLKYNRSPAWGDPAGFFEAGIDPTSGKVLWVWY